MLFLSLSFLAIASSVSAHGRVTNVTTSAGVVYSGWDPATAAASTPTVPLAAWAASNLGNIYVPPSQFNTSSIICHYNATPGALEVNTTAGDTLNLQWNEWPSSHVGPVVTYLAACNGSCADVHKQQLEWVKIDELGWLNNTGWKADGLGGTWASHVLIASRFQWTITIPAFLKEGQYVLRHEIIALHVAEQMNGAQAYPQCINLRVAGNKKQPGRSLNGGVLGPKLYSMRDKGILVNVHEELSGYEIPGPSLWEGVVRTKQPHEK